MTAADIQLRIHNFKSTTCSQLFPIKLTIRTLPPVQNFSDGQTTPLPQNSVSIFSYT